MAESGRTEQIISQFLLKALQIVLDSRAPQFCPPEGRNHTSRARKRDRWFNLALGDLPPSLENLHFWHPSVMDPIIIDIILIRTDDGASPEAVIERWTVQHELSSSSAGNQSGESSVSVYSRTYKKCIVLLRSLYSLLRLLPAYRAFRALNSSNHNRNFDISYKVSSFPEPFSRSEEGGMKHYSLTTPTPVETQSGHLSMSVSYRPDLSDFDLEVSSLLPPRIISDYVGSPAADPMRAFPSSPSAALSFPLRRVHSGPAPIPRPHSWTGNPLGMSPSVVSDLPASPVEVYGHRITDQLRLSAHGRGRSSFEAHQLSPPFSPSPTPSPPMHSNSPLRNLLSSETSPVSIPVPHLGRSNPMRRTPNFSDPTRNYLPPPSPRNTRVAHSSQESQLESKSFRKLEGSKTGESYQSLLGQTSQKGFRDGRDDSSRFSGMLSSGGSPRVFSRSSSRLSFQDDLEDCEFPFAVDDVDTVDPRTRNPDEKDASDAAHAFMSPRKSQDAAVGMLVHVLRSAAPLRQDHSCSSQSSKSEFDARLGSSSFFMSRKASDALEELGSYKEMRDMLLSQSGTQSVDAKRLK